MVRPDYVLPATKLQGRKQHPNKISRNLRRRQSHCYEIFLEKNNQNKLLNQKSFTHMVKILLDDRTLFLCDNFRYNYK